jgi:RNA polymerase sigma-70 factor (ECF subfamily)
VNIKNGEKKILWLFSVARYTIADYYRRRTPDTPVKPIDIPDLESKAVESTSDESKKLLPLIQSLPERYKTVLLKSDIYGESHKEIAQQFNLSVSCVKNRVVRGRRLLAEKMHECCSFSHDTYGNIVHCEEKEAYFDCLEKMKKV